MVHDIYVNAWLYNKLKIKIYRRNVHLAYVKVSCDYMPVNIVC